MPGPDGALGDRQGFGRGALGLIHGAAIEPYECEVRERHAGSRRIGPLQAAAKVERLAQVPLGFVGAAEESQRAPDIVPRLRDLAVVLAVQTATRCENVLAQSEGPADISLHPEGVAQVARGGERFGMILAEHRDLQAEGLLEPRDRLLKVAGADERVAESVELQRRLHAVAAVPLAGEVEELGTQLDRFGIEAQALVGARQNVEPLGAQRIGSRLGAQTGDAAFDELARRDRGTAPLVGDLEDLEQEAEGALAALGCEAGGVALASGLPGLPRRRRPPGRDGRHDPEGGADGQPVPSNKLPGAIADGVRPRQHRLVGEEAFDVVGQPVGRAVPAPGVLLQCLAHDGLEIGGNPAEPGRRGVRGGRVPAIRCRERRRIGFADHAFELAPAVLPEEVGRPAGEHLVEEEAELVDVRRGLDRLSADLLGRGIGRSQRPGRRARLGRRELQTLETPASPRGPWRFRNPGA